LRGSSYRSIRRDRAALKAQRKFRRRPLPHELACHRLAAANDARRGPLYQEITGYSERVAGGIRRMRSDAIDNLFTVAGQLIDLLQPNGAILRQVGGSWVALKQLELGFLAFGAAIQGELNPAARWHRHLAHLRRIGWVDVVERWDAQDGPGGRVYRGKAAFVRITQKALDALGIAAALRELLNTRARQRGEATAAKLAALTHAKKATPELAAACAGKSTPSAAPAVPRPPGDPAKFRAMMPDAMAALGLA
jgi:hypothetical protein